MTVENALDVLASLRLEDGARWGAVAEPFQWQDARAILDPSPPNMHFLTRPRGASKTGDLGGIAIAALLEQLPHGARGYAFAADRDQAGLLLDSISGFVTRTEGIEGALTVEVWKVISNRTGATLEIMAADEASAWGLRPAFVVIDEITMWRTTSGPKRLWRAIYSAMPKVPDARLVLLGSAGDPAHWSHKVLMNAKASPAWRVNEVPGPTPWLDKAAIEEQRRELPSWEFERLHLNRWTASEDRVADLDDLRALVQLDGPEPARDNTRYVMGLDIGIKRDNTALTVCHAEDAGEAKRIVLDRLHVWKPGGERHVNLEDVEATIVTAWESYNKPRLIFDWHQAGQMTQRLKRRGVRCVEFTFSPRNIAQLALTLHELIRSRRLALPDDPELIDELANVRLIESSPGNYRIDHDPDKHDDRAIALGLAAQELVKRGARRRAKVRVGGSTRPVPSQPMTGYDAFGRRLRDE